MFSSDAEVISIGGDYLTIVCSFYVLFSVFFLINGALRGAGDTVFSMFVTLFILWGVRIPMSMYLSQHHGVTGIWVGIPVSWFIGMALVLAWYKYGRWRKSLVATKNIDASAEVIE